MPEISQSKFLVQATWEDVPHLSDKAKEDLLASMAPHQRDARTKGVPSMGSGAIYPVLESDITCEPFAIPIHWPKAFGMDVGWKRTAAIWGAVDRATDTIYFYSEYYKGQAEPSIHATGIKARGAWIPGVVDPASHGRSQKDGDQLYAMYSGLGLNIESADNGVEAGLYAVWERLSTGRLKVFNTMQNFFAEYRLYRRDEKGNVVKENDHCLDAARYLIVSGIDRAIVQPFEGRWARAIGSAGGGDSTIGY